MFLEDQTCEEGIYQGSSVCSRLGRDAVLPERFKLRMVFLATIITHRSSKMDWDRVEGNWKQVKGKVKEKWGNLTDDDLTAINGQRDQLEGKIQERYGLAKDKVRKDVDDWYNAQSW